MNNALSIVGSSRNNSNYKKGLILDWHNDTVDAAFDKVNQKYFEKAPFINYSSYAMGLRYENLKK